MARRKASGPGSNSRRFADIRRPDGQIDRVPAAKDAATYLFHGIDEGSWPRKYFAKFLYEAIGLTPGVEFEMQEMRPGEGMGTRRRMRVLDVRSQVDVYPNAHAQLKRLVLVIEIPLDEGHEGEEEH